MDLENYLKVAEMINSAYDVRSTYSSDKKYDLMVIFDDDITAVLKSMIAYHHFKIINPEMKLLLVGGEGLLATAFAVMRFSLRLQGMSFALKRLKKETEAQRLKRVALELGVKENDIIIADNGRNTTENLQAISNIADGRKVLIVTLQRLAMVFKQSAEYQCNTYSEKFGCKPLDYDLYVIHQKVASTLRWYNFQAAAKGRVALHFYASLVRRFEVYDNKFLFKPFEPDEKIKFADTLLRSNFVIKQRLRGFGAIRAYFQYIPILWSIFCNAPEYLIDENEAIADAKKYVQLYLMAKAGGK